MNQAFEDYVKNYDMTKESTAYKYKHSYRVMENIKNITNEMNLSQQEKYIAEIIGLYHDIGRFEQDKKYNSFNDEKTFDHGDYGAKVLIENGLIKKLKIEEKYYGVIAKAVKNHNKLNIEPDLTEEELFYSKLIRDADKIDILYAMGQGLMPEKGFDYNDDSFSISKEVTDEFLKQHIIKRSMKKTNSEKALSYLALVFDINFKESAELIIERHIIDNFYSIQHNKENYKKYIDIAEEHLKEMIKC